MSLVYLEDGDGNTLTIVASKITAIQSKRVPTNTPGSEQQAYAIQGVSQELMAEYARQIGAK